MAKSKAKQTRAKPAAAPSDPRERIFAGAMDVALRLGWRRSALSDIAEAADMSLAELHAEFADKAAILRGLVDRADRHVLQSAPKKPDADASPRDRLFDVLMRRFDALQRHRAAVSAILRDAFGDPLAALASLPQFLRSMRWMGEAAGLPMDGVGGALRTKAIAVAWAGAMRTWLSDESPDLSRTMAALDQRLRWVERMGLFGRAERGGGVGASEAETGAPV